MAGENPLDLKKFLERSTAKTSLTDLQSKGVQNVRVLDQRTLERLMQDAVQKVLSGRAGVLSDSEREKIYQESRKELDRLVREYGTMKKQNEAAAMDKNTLLTELENVQKQLQVTRNMYEEKIRQLEARAGKGGADPAHLAQMQQQVQALQAQAQHAFQQGVQSQERYISELKERNESLEGEIVSLRQNQHAVAASAATEGLLAKKLEELASRDDAIADRISKVFAKTVEGLNRKIASIKAGSVGSDDVEYRASEQVLDNLLKEEIESNLGTVSSQPKVSQKSMDDRLSKLKNIQASFGKPKPEGEEKKE